MSFWWIAYYIVAVLLWTGLTVLAVASLRPALGNWFASHPRALAWLLGVERLPADAGRTLRRFYLYLDGGWTWLLVWSWWLLPWFKQMFYRNATSERTYQLARTSTLILLVATSVFGFFCIGRALQIWRKDLYRTGATAGRDH